MLPSSMSISDSLKQHKAGERQFIELIKDIRMETGLCLKEAKVVAELMVGRSEDAKRTMGVCSGVHYPTPADIPQRVESLTAALGQANESVGELGRAFADAQERAQKAEIRAHDAEQRVAKLERWILDQVVA